ncbi:MAG: IMP cyclohydrolase [Candidatus Aminicenantaceae bacterium]
MKRGLENLTNMKYPGRIIILGRDKTGENCLVIYAITGRSPSSKARKLVFENGEVWVRPTDQAVLMRGNTDLLVYPAVYIGKEGIAVSNGKQTEDIKEHLLHSMNPSEVLLTALRFWDYEPDAPNYTPRISGCVLTHKKSALSIIKRASDGSSERDVFEVSLIPGKGNMIATYSGRNIEPLPSFRGNPLEVDIEGKRAKDVAEDVYQSLTPKNRKEDYRVAVACIFSRDLAKEEFDVFIINRDERMRFNHERFG